VEHFRQLWQEALTYQDSYFLLQTQAALALYANGSEHALSFPALDSTDPARHWQQVREAYPHSGWSGLVLWYLRVGLVQGAPANNPSHINQQQ